MPRNKTKGAKSEAIEGEIITQDVQGEPVEKITLLIDHYTKWVQDNDTRRVRKNGWNDVIDAFMNKLPSNWPYTARVTDPRIWTSVLEKTARLINSKLRGHLEPRKGKGNIVKAKINNAVLEQQWDDANEGGSMIEKVAKSDQMTRLIGGSYVLNYWDDRRETNESKNMDPRDLGFDFAADHVKNARWAQVREWATYLDLEERGYDLKDLEETDPTSEKRAIAYESQVKENLGLEDRIGDDKENPILEVVTEWVPAWATADGKGRKTVFLPRYKKILEDGPNPYKHGEIPLAQLRYYSMPDDIMGRSEVEPVLPLARGINAMLCALVDDVNISNRPPIKVISGAVRMETIEYGPSAIWIQNQQGAIEEHVGGQTAIRNFNTIYPAMVAAFNNAMGDLSLGTSNIAGKGFNKKTATEVDATTAEQNQRDQYNQIFLSQFLKDIMMQWLSNNQQYLFDDESKHFIIYKIVGRDAIQELQKLKLDEEDIPPEVMEEMEQTAMQNPNMLTEDMLSGIQKDLVMPTNPVVTNPNDDPETYEVKKKLEVNNHGEADLYLTPEDLDGEFDYIPDVKSMAAGAGRMQEAGRKAAFELALNPQVTALLAAEGQKLKVSELLINMLEDAGYIDAQTFFEAAQPALPAGQGAPGVLPSLGGVPSEQGLPAVPQAAPALPGQGQVPPTQPI